MGLSLKSQKISSALWHYSVPYADLSVGSKIYWKSNLQTPLLFSLHLNKCKGNQIRKLCCSGMGLSIPFLTTVAPFWVESSLGNRWNRLILSKVSFYGALITLLPVFFQAFRNWVIVADTIFSLSQIWLNFPGSKGSSQDVTSSQVMLHTHLYLQYLLVIRAKLCSPVCNAVF